MNISSDTADMYCEPQYSRMRVMIPAVQRQHGILLVRAGQQNDVEFTGGQGYIPRNFNNNQQANCINLHGNTNTNVKILNKIAADINDDENPIDLSSTSTIVSSSVKTNENKEFSGNNLQELKNTDDIEVEKRLTNKIIKRKISSGNASGSADSVNNDNNKRHLESWVGHVKPVPGIPRQAGSKREEVLKAARSLFSKRTRTLYHWLCPSTSKTKLKSTVSAAWDTLSTAEKDFYISQVLGRFGVPACSLMVNPQLGGLKTNENPGSEASSSSTGPSSNMEETRRAVSNLLLNENDVPWSPYPQRQNDDLPRKKRKYYKTYKPGESSNNKESNKHPEEEETLILKEIRDASLEEDFADDPELNTEFEQFRWALHVSNANEQETNKQ